ncbi:dihydroxyacetone kinase subunit DhaL [Dactylosporangium sp. NPDC000521]|uniref:dihydroxyacetone kinase subunit DhaL n=1 Tax=Dactylosporangium sp. NPDC000521 TaxID=3363975 RepID=UPI0036B5503A
MTNPDTAQGRFLHALADRSAQFHAELTAYDLASGDGDFGDNLRDGMAAVVSRLTRGTEEPLQAAAAVFLDEVGGTSGPLLGLLFAQLAVACGDSMSAQAVAQGLSSGLDAIQRVGEAAPGDRTLVDALFPAVATLKAGGSLAEAAAAASEGAHRTATLTARRGRASYVGERAVGAPDPGAIGIALLVREVAEAAEPGSTTLSAADVVTPANGATTG